MRLSIRSLIAAAMLIVLGQTPAAWRVDAQPAAELLVIATPLEGSAGPQYAQFLGTFKKYGLTVRVQAANNGEAAAAAVAGGAADIAIGNVLSLAVAHQKGIPLTLIAPSIVHVLGEPTNALVVAQQSAIRTAADLGGKTIGVQAVSDLNTAGTKTWLDKNGGDSKSVKFVELPTSQMGTSVGNHTIDAAVIGSPPLLVALASPCCRVLAYPYDAIGSRFLINGWYARNEWIAAHRDEARRFARAVVEAQVWANKNRAESARILAAWSKIDPDVMSRMPRETFAERFEPGLIQPLIDLAGRYRLIPAPFPATDLYEAF